MISDAKKCIKCGFTNEKESNHCSNCGNKFNLEIRSETTNKQKLTFEYDPKKMGTIDYSTQIRKQNVLYYTVQSRSNILGFTLNLLLFTILFLLFGLIFMSALIKQNLWFLLGGGFSLIVSILVAINGFFRFIPMNVENRSGRSIGEFKSKINVRKLASLYSQKVWTFRDSTKYKEYSLYFSKNKGNLKINNSKISLQIVKHDNFTFEMIDNRNKVTFDIEIENKDPQNNRLIEYTISTNKEIDETVILFVGYALLRSGQLNSFLKKKEQLTPLPIEKLKPRENLNQEELKQKKQSLIKSALLNLGKLIVTFTVLFALWIASERISVNVYVLALFLFMILGTIFLMMYGIPLAIEIKEYYDLLTQKTKRRIALVSLGINSIFFPLVLLLMAIGVVFMLPEMNYSWLMYGLIICLIVCAGLFMRITYEFFMKPFIHYKNNNETVDDKKNVMMSFIGLGGVVLMVIIFIPLIVRLI